nr:MAG TPA: hypothetical protein [Caudoviricetes sp.]
MSFIHENYETLELQHTGLGCLIFMEHPARLSLIYSTPG